MISNFEGKTIGTEQEILDLRWANASEGEVIADLFSSTDTDREMDLCQYFGQKKSKDYAAFLSSSSSFC